MEMNRLIVGNNVEVMTTIPDDSIDMIIFSPPYDEIREYNGYKLDLHSVGRNAYRVLKNGGMMAVVINDGTKNFGKSLTTYRTILDYCDNIGFKLFENIIYSRNGRPGAWWNKRFRVDHEYILLFLKGDRPKYFNKSPLMIDSIHAGKTWHGTQRLTSGETVKIEKKTQANKKCRGTIWKYNTSNSEGDRNKLEHPATFPDKLVEDLIACFTNVGDVVLDPFVGSGTTCLVAERMDRRWVGIDISEKYISLAQRRMDKLKNATTT